MYISVNIQHMCCFCWFVLFCFFFISNVDFMLFVCARWILMRNIIFPTQCVDESKQNYVPNICFGNSKKYDLKQSWTTIVKETNKQMHIYSLPSIRSVHITYRAHCVRYIQALNPLSPTSCDLVLGGGGAETENAPFAHNTGNSVLRSGMLLLAYNVFSPAI